MSQNQQILIHLKHRGAITPLEAFRDYDCGRLSARIYDLRNAGHDIDTHLIQHKNKRFAQYTLRK